MAPGWVCATISGMPQVWRLWPGDCGLEEPSTAQHGPCPSLNREALCREGERWGLYDLHTWLCLHTAYMGQRDMSYFSYLLSHL